MDKKKLLEDLNGKTSQIRLEALKRLLNLEAEEKDFPIRRELDANNHIHSTYSFSPYSPTKAAYMAYRNGLTSAGIMDHDSLGGAKEFKVACAILGLGSTVGVEMRVKFIDGNCGRINHPDQDNCIYMAAHGIPLRSVDRFDEYISKFRNLRNVRNRKMVDKINDNFAKHNISIDFDKDVVAISMAEDRGSITERHLMSALATKLEKKFGRSEELINFLKAELKLNVSEKLEKLLLDKDNPFFNFDLLGILKSDTEFFYINADEELPDVDDLIYHIKKFGGIPAYAYLGDVGHSVTGDKKMQKFEDDYIEILFDFIKMHRFEAVAYMPTRNTLQQLKHIKELCARFNLFEISGEDINSPRQGFPCEALQDPEFVHLIDATWALIGHEMSVEEDPSKGMFSRQIKERIPELIDRIDYFKKIGRGEKKK